MKTLKQDLYNMKKENDFSKQVSSMPKPMNLESFPGTIDVSDLISTSASNISFSIRIMDSANGN